MDSVVKMAPEERRLAFIQAEERLGLQAASIEKDFWVCWTLRELAGLPEIRDDLENVVEGRHLAKEHRQLRHASSELNEAD